MGDSGEPETNPSRARDHLANERTWLAWLRNAGNAMVVGLAIAKFGHINAFTISAGAVLVFVGTLGLGYGTLRYWKVNREFERGRYTTGSRGHGAIIAATVLTVAVLVALVLLIIGGQPDGG